MNGAYNALNILPYYAFGLKYEATKTYAVGKSLTRAKRWLPEKASLVLGTKWLYGVGCRMKSIGNFKYCLAAFVGLPKWLSLVARLGKEYRWPVSFGQSTPERLRSIDQSVRCPLC